MNANKQSESEALVELRQLLLGDELEKLDGISERVEVAENFSSCVGDILPQAILKSAKQGDELSQAMVPTVEEIIRLSIKNDIVKFANALFPVIGPAIRKSISETFRQMMQALNRTLEQSFSWKGLKWRLESLRTGIPISQIALLHGLVYRVEQVFFIHRTTGLLLNNIEQPDSHNQNADLVSSMLSAINDFVSDSFKVEANQSLGSIEVGDLSIWIERGPDSILALAIRGEAPNSLRTQMQETVEDLEMKFSDSLAEFSGDVEVFDTSGTILEDCMQSQYQDRQNRDPSLAKWLLALLLVLFFGWLGAEKHQSLRQDEYVDILQNEPGYVITEASERGGLLVVRGLRDPLAQTPETLLTLSSLDADEVVHRFEPYQSLQAEFVSKRLAAILEPPPTVSMEVVEQVLVVTGSAVESWRARLSTLAPLIAGINAYDDSALDKMFVPELLDLPSSVDANFAEGVVYLKGRAEQEWISGLASQVAKYAELQRIDTSALVNSTEEALVATIEALEEEVIYFDAATSFQVNEMDSTRITSLARKVVDLSKRLDRSVLIVVKGFSDSVGSFEDNVLLSIDRAEYVAQVIYLAGIDPKYIQVKGLDAPVAVETNQSERRQNRRVNFVVTIE